MRKKVNQDYNLTRKQRGSGEIYIEMEETEHVKNQRFSMENRSALPKKLGQFFYGNLWDWICKIKIISGRLGLDRKERDKHLWKRGGTKERKSWGLSPTLCLYSNSCCVCVRTYDLMLSSYAVPFYCRF